MHAVVQLPCISIQRIPPYAHHVPHCSLHDIKVLIRMILEEDHLHVVDDGLRLVRCRDDRHLWLLGGGLDLRLDPPCIIPLARSSARREAAFVFLLINVIVFVVVVFLAIAMQQLSQRELPARWFLRMR